MWHLMFNGIKLKNLCFIMYINNVNLIRFEYYNQLNWYYIDINLVKQK